MMPLYFLIASACIFIFTLIVSIAYKAMGKKMATQDRIEKMFGSHELTSEKAYKARRKISNKKLAFRSRVMSNFSSELSCAGIKLRAEEFLLIWAACAFGCSGVSLLLGMDWMVPLALFIIGAYLPLFFLKRKKAKRIALLEDQLSNALIIIGNCLKTGLSFQHALDSIAREMPEPISKEFGRVLKEIQLGLTMETALQNMADRLKSKDFMLIVSAVLIQRQAGGNLSEIMQNISDTIRDRLKIKANLRVLTTTGRTSGRVIGLLPVFLLLILMIINPSYVRVFFETKTGTIMLIVGGFLEIIGYLVAKKVVSVKY